MIYADYSYYTDEYGGNTISESDFRTFAVKASERINAVTFGRLENGIPEAYTENIKRCCCELAENIHKYGNVQATENGAVSSEKIGSYSIDYQSTAEQIAAVSELDDVCDDVIRRHLGRTGLLYRGVYD